LASVPKKSCSSTRDHLGVPKGEKKSVPRGNRERGKKRCQAIKGERDHVSLIREEFFWNKLLRLRGLKGGKGGQKEGDGGGYKKRPGLFFRWGSSGKEKIPAPVEAWPINVELGEREP